MKEKTIYIADIKSRNTGGKLIGHFVPVAKNYQEIFAGKCKVKVCGGPIYKQYFDKYELVELPYDNYSDSVIGKLRTFINAICLFYKARHQIIVLQQSTPITAFVAIACLYWFTSKLYLIQYNTESVNSTLKRFIYKCAKRKINGFIVPNERVGKSFSDNYCIVTDYIYSKSDVKIVPFAERIWDFGIVGSIFKDKGSLPALEYLASKGFKVLIAGGIGEYELENPIYEIVEKYPNIEYHIGFVDDADFKYYIGHSKYCVLNYCGTYFDRSSGVVLDVIFNGTPVVGTRCSALNIVDENRLGLLYEDIAEINNSNLFDEKKFELYLNSIRKYIDNQSKVRDCLCQFVKN
ncbi:glycosyltransferase family 1 protein [Bacteroides xylanisolvens]|jgi:hypothetical protein|uniref:Glycosyltransferase family 1 protein n=1 Tax=Bacteroides xylanisolvens TaxID=371601 RepID=A0A412VZG9_9BACE|nr:glycosyltransferase family 1 protein [Bacteroides xylanisolvens]QUR43378.1 glycosyltransferase family 1 protein [Bacteroides xylanisolvens]RGV15384.1 glycosyltransferase family 1 protein [Bacteroides xylanisolvens]